jgi:hypothetical protein
MSATDEWYQEISDARADMTARWLPSAEARTVAAAMLTAAPDADHVVVALVQPGKTQGVWITGQEVRTVGGAFWLVQDGILSHRDARNAATEAAQAALGDTAGTCAYALIERDERVAVFEW